VSAVPKTNAGPARTAVVVVCRDVTNLLEEVQVVHLAGSYITKNELADAVARN
jgi:hypothetical protein